MTVSVDKFGRMLSRRERRFPASLFWPSAPACIFGDRLLFFTGFSRFTTDFGQDQIKNMTAAGTGCAMQPGRQRRRCPARSEDAAVRARRIAAPVLADHARTRLDRLQFAGRRHPRWRPRRRQTLGRRWRRALGRSCAQVREPLIHVHVSPPRAAKSSSIGPPRYQPERPRFHRFSRQIKCLSNGRSLPHGASGRRRDCNELNRNVFGFHDGSGRQLTRVVLGEGGASGLIGGPFES
jgi:hypothetical protein